MRILVCGGRDYNNYTKVSEVLNRLCIEHSKEFNPDDNWLPTDITIISGKARGADTLAADFAVVNFCVLEEYPADWKTYGKSAGHIRNKQMLEEGKPDLVVAFPGGRGTENMVSIAEKAGVPVIKIEE